MHSRGRPTGCLSKSRTTKLGSQRVSVFVSLSLATPLALPEMQKGRSPSKNERDPPTDNIVRDLLLILGVVFAALQVLPSYVSSKSLLFQLIIVTLAFGAFGFLLLRF